MALKQNIIYIYFKGKHLVTSKSQYQYNHGQYLYFADLNLPQAFEVHFSNKDKGESKTQIGSNKLVEIPDEYFWSGASQIYAWVYLHSEINDGETIYEVRIPLIKRAKPTDEEPLPQQESVMERAIAELNNAVEITTENANKTEEDKTQVSNIKDEIIDLKDDIDGTADTVNQKAQEAIDASVRSENSAQHAAEYESGAQNYSQQAEQSAQRALESESVARQKAQVATDASAEALGYRDEALDAKNKAEQAKQNIVDYRDETKGYRDETLNIKNDVQTLKGQIDETASDVSDISASVKADAQSASNSAGAASQSANSADQSAESASLSESKARQSEINAYNSANNASQSAEQARQFKNQSETNASHYPKIVNGFWYVWDASNNEFKNTDVDAHGLKGDKGDKGDTGNGIASTVLNSDYTLTITFTDGTTYKSQSIRGEKGLKGDKGDTGNGIASTVLNNDYTLTVTFTDGTTYTTPSIRGQQGEKGDKGDVGESGVYIGADEPQDDDIKVWIDTDEAGTEADLIQDVVDSKEENKKIIANLATDTASGSIASFSDGADDLPLKSLVVDINPVQDLHGQERPYPAGGGKNILPYASKDTDSKNGVTWTKNSDGSITFSGTCSASAAMTFVEFKLPAGDYLFSNVGSTFAYTGGNRPTVYIRDLDNSLSLANIGFGQSANGISFSLSAETNIRFYAVFQTDNVVSGVLYPMIRLASVTDATYAPYRNLCPISGWTDVDVEQRGSNLWDGLGYTSGSYLNVTGGTNSNSPYAYTDYIPVAPNSTYYVSGIGGSNPSICWYDKSKNFIGGERNGGVTSKTISVPSNAHFIRVSFPLDNINSLCINYPSTDHDYHPYTGRSITISLGQTVYGGKLDVLSGELTIDRAMVDLGTLTWVYDTTTHPTWAFFRTIISERKAGWNNFINSIYPLTTSQYDRTGDKVITGASYYSGKNIIVRDTSYTDATAFKTAVTGQQLVYELATPIEIQLSANQLNSLYGQNNIWADSGDAEVEYRADTSLYVKRKITEAIAALS